MANCIAAEPCYTRKYRDLDGHAWEHRWPSGKVGVGEPEFRRVEQSERELIGRSQVLAWGETNGEIVKFRRVEQAADLKHIQNTIRMHLNLEEIDRHIGDFKAWALGNLPTYAEFAPPAHVHLRELLERDSIFLHRRLVREGEASPCPHCGTGLPDAVADAIALGTLDCPSCGWHAGRCEHCHGLLTKRWDSQCGRMVLRCQDCEGVDE
jgi:predicted RNA-binding Zn-ribbon protein involved in translation (DUF1610 family)